MSIDLNFENLEQRAIQYNARASVSDFSGCMTQYARWRNAPSPQRLVFTICNMGWA
ncbi:Uncharacterised protein [Serratia fonticola]|uniref:Uncharacterized protein n=1 Tax=Serratia fonticola TaxID=47917 RepID=A0A4U9WD74_SERFO|nr:Uncharacterised protein [Serratia fonticola]